MAIEHHFYMDTAASRHELRDALVRAGFGLKAAPDWKNTSGASSAATNVTILDDLSWRSGWPDNGVAATRSLTFRDRKVYLSNPDHPEDFETQTIQGVVALLKAFPEADAYWTAYDAERPVLLRRGGRLVLAQALDESNGFWGAEGSPERSLVDLPYTVEPLGPWDYVGDDQEFWDQLEAYSRAQKAR
jgi:hypothetical protein